jgi:two-component system phosphate regulon sensor histidine kinase PhoR
LDNAVKYSDKAGQVDITVSKKDEAIEIVIKDQGRGINREHQSRIFNRFYRVDRARSRQQGGTGLGLAIVKHIIQYHNGKIEVKSQRYKGSSFIISIPV